MRFRWKRKPPFAENTALPAFPDNGSPDFFCIGAQKAGTSWLYHQLNCHADFWMPPLKELHYFDQISRSRHPDPKNWRTLQARDQRDQFFIAAMEKLCATPFIDLHLYGKLFAPKRELLSGDITPQYSTLPEEMIATIMDHFPQLKVVFIARDPVERSWSALWMGVNSGNLAPFDPADPDVVMQHLLHSDILLRSFPSMTAERWRRHVPAGQLRICFFDDLERDPATFRADIIRFLGVDPEKSNGEVTGKIHESTNKPVLSAQVRKHLAQFFGRELKACAAELGGAAAKWPARYGF